MQGSFYNDIWLVNAKRIQFSNQRLPFNLILYFFFFKWIIKVFNIYFRKLIQFFFSLQIFSYFLLQKSINALKHTRYQSDLN